MNTQSCVADTQSGSQSKRFTVDGSERLERHLAAICDRVRSCVREVVPAARLEGMLLAGGYGRGEGGVLKMGEEEAPYNDLEFYVFVRGNRFLAERQFGSALHEAAEALSDEAGVEIEFKLLTLRQLCSSPVSMFYYDLVQRHRWVIGEEDLLARCEHHRDSARIPISEAARLLLNRCSGLLFAAERSARPEFSEEDADFVGRNLAKARLGFGDAFLAALGAYHWSCRERHIRLLGRRADVPWAEEIIAHHAEGVEFKLHPHHSIASQQSLRRQHDELKDLGKRVWLWVESRRLGRPQTDVRAYALGKGRKCSETARARNWLLNVRTFGARGLLDLRYPRERLYNSMALLLWEPDVEKDPELLAKVQAGLNTRANSFPLLVRSYVPLWRRFH